MSHFSFDKNSVLGTGSFGKVYKGKYFKLPVAVKKLKNKTPRAIDDFKNEIQTLMYINSLHFNSNVALEI